MTHSCPHCAIVEVLAQHWAEHGADLCRSMASKGQVPIESIDSDGARVATAVLALSQVVGEMVASAPVEHKPEIFRRFLEGVTQHAGGGVVTMVDQPSDRMH